jgi:hypothetical protein
LFSTILIFSKSKFQHLELWNGLKAVVISPDDELLLQGMVVCPKLGAVLSLHMQTTSKTN